MKAWVIVLILLIGVALGVSGTILAPKLAGPYLPESFRAKAEVVEGEVDRKLREQDRLLLTVQTSQGTVLATFKQKVAEIDLLVQKGDTVTLALRRYEPFVEDPAIERVRKLQPTKPEAAKQEPIPLKAGEPSPPDTGGASTY
ncbi:MAG: hypothetical protein HW376_1419 [candidate division NC10 bacterium]|nr:hypothetical protein [candidate division NC10 bacterium]